MSSLSRVAIFIPAYQAARVIESTLERIPLKVWEMVDEIFVHDNCSTDGTAEIAKRCGERLGGGKFKLFELERNIGYGGTKKRAYQYAVRRGFDFVVMLHADGQYPPEYIPELLAPLVRGECEMVQGSRVDHLKGGMPLYKIIANRALNMIEEAVFGYRLHEYHSGFLAYSCKALAKMPLERLSDWHLITAEIVALLKYHGMRAREVCVPTFYTDKTSSCSFSTSVRYGIGVLPVLFGYLLASKKLSLGRLYEPGAQSLQSQKERGSVAER